MGHKLTKADSIKGGKNSKRKPLDELWRAKLEEYDEEKDGSILDGLFDTLATEGKAGNIQAIKEALDRAYGKSNQKLQLSGDEDKPVIIRTERQKKFIESTDDNQR
jgi:hypothetical protein